MNQMQDKVLAALRSIIEEHELEWVELQYGPSSGTIRVQQAGRFFTLLRLDYEFEERQMRLILICEGKSVGGRCGLSYDDGAGIEHVITECRQWLAQCAAIPCGCRANALVG